MNIETELARRSIGPASEPNVGVSRAFLADVLAFIRKQSAKIADLEERVSAMPPEPPAFDVVKQIQQSEGRGCVKREFARRVERGML